MSNGETTNQNWKQHLSWVIVIAMGALGSFTVLAGLKSNVYLVFVGLGFILLAFFVYYVDKALALKTI